MRENLDKAAYYRPSNLTAIIDVNRLGQRGPTKLEGGHDRLPAACRGVQLQHRHHRLQYGGQKQRDDDGEDNQADAAKDLDQRVAVFA